MSKITIIPKDDANNKPSSISNVPDTVVKVKGKIVNSREIDLVFVIDTTGSMSNKINGLLQTCSKFVDEFVQLDLNHRVAIMAFGDLKVKGDKITVTDFINNVETMKKSLKNIPRYSGGGNEGESSFDAISKAINLNFRPNAVKVLILITDEPAHQDEFTADGIIQDIKRKEFLAFVISTSQKYYKEIANKNGGKWYRISATTDFTDLLDMFRDMAIKVTQVVTDVYELSNGDVSAYLKLKSPEE